MWAISVSFRFYAVKKIYLQMTSVNNLFVGCGYSPDRRKLFGLLNFAFKCILSLLALQISSEKLSFTV